MRDFLEVSFSFCVALQLRSHSVVDGKECPVDSGWYTAGVCQRSTSSAYIQQFRIHEENAGHRWDLGRCWQGLGCNAQYHWATAGSLLCQTPQGAAMCPPSAASERYHHICGGKGNHTEPTRQRLIEFYAKNSWSTEEDLKKVSFLTSSIWRNDFFLQ